jgi:hypothetical protein
MNRVYALSKSICQAAADSVLLARLRRKEAKTEEQENEAKVEKGTSFSLQAVPRLCSLLLVLLACASCGPKAQPAASTDRQLSTTGTIEVTAKLLEIPEGAIFKRDLYDYATVLKYQVLKVHRGQVKTDTIYVGHYNPWKPRAEAPDGRVKTTGGNLRRFQAGQVHHMALELPIEDFFMGGIVNKYFGKTSDPIYWAVWTDLESP